jgi:hypothetical protein
MNPSSHDNSHHIRRVVLPSGRAIEVVYFDNEIAPSTPPAVVDSTVVDLHVCPECEQGLVYPVEWEEASPTQWEVALRCPNCEWEKLGIFEQTVVDRFDEELDRGTEDLVEDLQRLTQANMEDEIERFTYALNSDAIWPMDF